MTKLKEKISTTENFVVESVKVITQIVRDTIAEKGEWGLRAYGLLETKEGEKVMALIPCMHSIRSADDTQRFADAIRNSVREFARSTGFTVLGVITAMEGWGIEIPIEQKNTYDWGDASKHPGRIEVVVISTSLPDGINKAVSYKIVRDGRGAKLEETPQFESEDYESRFNNLV